MRSMRRWVVVTACVVAAVVAGCGTPTGDGPSTSTSSSTTTEVTTTTMSPWGDAACRTERATIETANEAHKVTHGVYAESLDRLVGEWLAHPPQLDWTYTSDGASFTLTGPC